MVYEYIAAQLVRKTLRGRAHTPVIFFAVTATECLDIKHADGIDCDARHQHAKTHARWNFDRTACIGGGEHRIEIAKRQRCRHLVRDCEARITAERGVVGKRRHARCLWRGDCARDHPVKPAIGDDGIAVEQYDITLGVQLDRAVAGCDEAEIGCILDECNSSFACEIVQILADRLLRTGVVHHDDFRNLRILCGQDAFDACARFGRTAVNRNDDVDAAQGDLQC